MTFKGYTARIEFDPRDNIFIGKVIGIDDSITFHGSTVDELTDDFHAAVDHYISDYCLSADVLERVRKGEESVIPLDEVEKKLGLTD